MKKRSFYLEFVLFLLLNISVYSQFPQEGRLRIPFEADRIALETLTFPSTAKSTGMIIVNARIPMDFITCVREKGTASESFKGRIEMNVEILDKKRNSIAREIFIKEITRENNDKSLLKDKSIETSITFNLASGDYILFVELTDKESQNTQKREIPFLKVKNSKESGLSDLSFISIEKMNDNVVKFVNRSGDIPFGENVAVFSQYINQKDLTDSIFIHITKFDEKGKKLILDQLIPSEAIMKANILKQKEKFSYEMNIEKDSTFNIIYYPIQSNSFEIGKYQASIIFRKNNITDSVNKNFSIVWYNMPMSLINFKIAQKKIELICSKEEYNELTSGSMETQRDKFIEFWKKKDPTPKTAYNEVMAEFYRRVDYATITYSTYRILDGSETDRGKVYIINGKPDNTERNLNPNTAPKETWIYNNLKKKYIFTDENRQGNYILTGIENI